MRIRADLHIHTLVSDGKASPVEVLYTALDKGLDAIAITDHNSFRGAVQAKKYIKNLPEPMVVIIGNEIRTQYGDVLVYCLDEVDIPNTLPELIDRAHENNCLVVPAHPFSIFRSGIGDVIYEYKGWDAIEVFNASASKGANKKAVEAAKILGLPGLASSDAHILEYIGVAYTIIEVNELSDEEILEAIRKGYVKPKPGKPPFNIVAKRFTWAIEKVFRKRAF